MSSNPVFIDLFAGCGGLSLGLLQAGWQGMIAVEKNKDAFATLSHNLIDSGRFKYGWPAWLPKKEHGIEELLEKYNKKLGDLKGNVDLIAGGPPCQGFSPAGKRDPNDPRNKLAEKYIELVDLVRPKFLLMENVRGFNSPFNKFGHEKAGKPYAEIVKEKLESIGYVVNFEIIRSADFGVPQIRHRFILIASRRDVSISISPFLILEEYRADFLALKGLPVKKPVTVKQAICDLELAGKKLIDAADSPVKGFKQIDYATGKKPISSYTRLMRSGCGKNYSPSGLRLPNHSSAVKDRFICILGECEKGKTLKQEDRDRYGIKKHAITPLDPDRPSATVTTLPDDILHYSEPRILTVREMARLQSFPDWYEFLGPYTTGGQRRKVTCPKYTQVGNAVPPLLANALALVIRGCLELAGRNEAERALS